MCIIFSFVTFLLLQCCTFGLIITHNFQDGLEPYTYQTFSVVAMYNEQDTPSTASPGNGNSYIHFQLTVYRELSQSPAALELIVIPDANIDDIGIEYENELHICCTQLLVNANKCNKEDLDRLVLKKDVTGLYRYEITFEKGQTQTDILVTDEIQVTAIHVFAMASCQSGLGLVTFEGRSVWMNPYGHLPGDVYGYLPFFGWMCIVYLLVAVFWFCINAIFWKELLYVQNCITGVLGMCLIEMATWYFDYLQLNNRGTRHQAPFVFGLITTVTRRMVSLMLVVAVSMGYGVIKPTLGPVKNKLVALGCLYWVFAFMFEALIHYNQTEKVETWMRVILIPPVAILNGIFWWWTFSSLHRTIATLTTRKQSAKLKLYKSFTLVLVAALLAAIGFAIYEMYYVLRELYFVEWEHLWFVEVGFWQILFSVIFIAIMILWRPSEHSKTYVHVSQLGQDEDAEDDEEEDDDIQFGKPDTANDEDDEDQDELGGAAPAPKFTIDDEDDENLAPDEPAKNATGDGISKLVDQNNKEKAHIVQQKQD